MTDLEQFLATNLQVDIAESQALLDGDPTALAAVAEGGGDPFLDVTQDKATLAVLLAHGYSEKHQRELAKRYASRLGYREDWRP